MHQRDQVDGLPQESRRLHLLGKAGRVCVGAQDYHRDLTKRFVDPLHVAEFLAIHHRHHHVEQDHAGLRRGGAQLVERIRAVRRLERAVVAVGQHLDDGAPGVCVVLDDENGPGARRRAHIRACGTRCRPATDGTVKRGSSTTKVAPSPAALSTEMVPWCASTMCRVM